MAQPYWDDDPDAWDTLILAGQPMPGVATIRGLVGSRFDVALAEGTDGGDITHRGYEPSQFTITLLLGNAREWTAYQERLPELRPKPGKGTPEPKDAAHPVLRVYGIGAIVVKSISFPVSTGGGGRSIDLSVVEYFPPKKEKNVTKKLTGSKSAPPLTALPVAGTAEPPASTEVNP